jgi:hypothetical protein
MYSCRRLLENGLNKAASLEFVALYGQGEGCLMRIVDFCIVNQILYRYLVCTGNSFICVHTSAAPERNRYAVAAAAAGVKKIADE